MREGGQRRHNSVLLLVVADAGFVHIVRKQSQLGTSSHLGVMLVSLLLRVKSVCALVRVGKRNGR